MVRALGNKVLYMPKEHAMSRGRGDTLNVCGQHNPIERARTVTIIKPGGVTRGGGWGMMCCLLCHEGRRSFVPWLPLDSKDAWITKHVGLLFLLFCLFFSCGGRVCIYDTEPPLIELGFEMCS